MSEQLKAGVIGLGILGGQHVRFLDDQPEKIPLPLPPGPPVQADRPGDTGHCPAA